MDWTIFWTIVGPFIEPFLTLNSAKTLLYLQYNPNSANSRE